MAVKLCAQVAIYTTDRQGNKTIIDIVPRECFLNIDILFAYHKLGYHVHTINLDIFKLNY